VEVKDRLYGFDLSNVANTTIQGINLLPADQHRLELDRTTINDINASYISQFMVVQNGGSASPAGIQLYGSNSILEKKHHRLQRRRRSLHR